MPYSSVVRRFTVVTGSPEMPNAHGVIFPDNRCIYQGYLANSGLYTSEISGQLSDFSSKYGILPGYTFSYTDAASVTFTVTSPGTGTSAGGTVVTLTGTGFLAAGLGVTFGGTAATTISVNATGTTITVTTPAHAAGLVNVVVTNANGSATMVGSFTYT